MKNSSLKGLALALLFLPSFANASLIQNFFADDALTEQIGFVEFTTLTPTSVADVVAFELVEESGLMIGLADLTNIEAVINSITGIFEDGEIGFRSPNFLSLGHSWTRTYFFQDIDIKSALTIIPGDCAPGSDCRNEISQVRFFNIVPGERVAQVPAPASLLLLAMGLLIMGWRRSAN